MIGKTISHYEIVDMLGKGGMGEIYVARDRKLNRRIALKVLPRDLASDPERLARFEREAKAVAALNHPNIVTIHSVEETDDGMHFLTLELVEGKTLGELIPRGGMSLESFLEIAIPLADGLGTAHEQGITHRDLKPTNIMVSKEGRAKILDFGLAKLRRESEEGASESPTEELTQQGRILGTVPYMSPEQLQGKPVDHRSDIFSLGIIFYEMATARRPFHQDNRASLISSILRDTPDSVTDVKASLPAPLGQLIGRCLEKDPSNRFQTAGEIRRELEALRRDVESGTLRSDRVFALTGRLKTYKTWGLVMAAGVLVLGASYLLTRSNERTASVAERDPGVTDISSRKRIVVLPFENLGLSENQYFADGITEEIISRLAVVRGLGVISRKSALYYAGTEKTIKQIGDELSVEYVLAGTVRWAGGTADASRVRITPQLIRASDDTHLWAASYDRVLDDIFGVQSEIAEQVIDQLGIALLEPERKRLASKPTENLEAYQAYLLGLQYVRTPDYSVENGRLAVQMFQRAVELDPDFAVAHSELSRAHSLMYFLGHDRSEERRARAKRSAERAVELAPGAPASHLAIGYYHYWTHNDYESALREFGIAEERLPSDSVVLEAKGFVFRRQGRWEEALAALEKALQLNPRDPQLYSELGESYTNLRRYREAVHYFDQAIAYAPDQPWPYLSKASTYWLWTGTTKEARATLEAMPETEDTQAIWMWFWQRIYERDYHEALDGLSSTPGQWIRYFQAVSPKSLLSAHAYRLMNEPALARNEYNEARKMLETEVKTWPNDPRVHSALGIAYAGLGRKDDAIREGMRAMEVVAKDRFSGATPIEDLALIYTLLGEHEAAVDQIAQLLSMDFMVSVPLLRLDPSWEPLRSNPRFRKLLEKYQ